MNRGKKHSCPQKLNAAQLTGCSESHLVDLPCGNRMQDQAAQAFEALHRDAQLAGFELVIASSFRSFERQRTIWNGKASGERPIHDDFGRPLSISGLSPREILHAILRFTALPGSSRHHWGTDVDVYDQAAVARDYCVQLTPQEVAPGGLFDPFHCWLDQRMAAGESHGFYRPYAQDRGGVAVERWHLSYAPVSIHCAQDLSLEVLKECWDNCEGGLLLGSELDKGLPEIVQRYLLLADDWCPAQ